MVNGLGTAEPTCACIHLDLDSGKAWLILEMYTHIHSIIIEDPGTRVD